MPKLLNKKLLTALLVTSIVGCASSPEDSTDSADQGADAAQTSSTDASADSTYADPAASQQQSTPLVTDPDLELRSTKVFYFDYDLADLKADAFEPLKAHARFLMANRGAKVRLEGHCDERGTREYNIALGERRGNAVAKFLKVQGVSSSQIEVISYGEERPVSLGHTESAWAMNRRVELVY